MIDRWTSGPGEATVSYQLTPGYHDLIVTYAEYSGLAHIALDWAPAAPTTPTPVITEWRGEYYANLSLSGTPALVRQDADFELVPREIGEKLRERSATLVLVLNEPEARGAGEAQWKLNVRSTVVVRQRCAAVPLGVQSASPHSSSR